jgi:AcrR family transcriptional regulator
MAQRVKKSRETMRSDLIAAATRLFAERGFASPTLREITKEAGVSLPIVYWFFADKAQLYEQCCVQLVSESFEIFLEATRVSADPPQMLYLFVRELCANHMNNGATKIIHRLLLDKDMHILSQIIKGVAESPMIGRVRCAIQAVAPTGSPDLKIFALISFVAGFIEHALIWQQIVKGSEVLSTPETIGCYVLELVFPRHDWSSISRRCERRRPAIEAAAAARPRHRRSSATRRSR